MMISKYNFHCPYCNAGVNQKDKITLKTQRENGDIGEIKMAATVGNYEYEHIPPVKFNSGELVDFLCPSCDKTLNSKEFEKYALLKMYVEENIVFEVLFSRQAGVQKTYLITEDGIESYTGN